MGAAKLFIIGAHDEQCVVVATGALGGALST